jgi:hypothetical protein
MATHAQIARNLLVGLPDGVFAHAAREGVLNGNYAELERMFRSMKFASRKTGPDLWELVGTASDGSTIVWQVGG